MRQGLNAAACWCCTAGSERPDVTHHCPSCHSVAMHGLSEFNFVSVVNGIPVYWGTDQAAAVGAARAGAGYVTITPILVDFRPLADDPAFRPVLATPFGDAPVPLDAVRQRRLEQGRDIPHSVMAGVADSHGVRVVELQDPPCICPGITDQPDCPRHGRPRPPESTGSVQHADTVPIPRIGATAP